VVLNVSTDELEQSAGQRTTRKRDGLAMQTLLALQSCFAGPRPTQTDFNALFWRQKWRVLLTVLLNKIFESFTGRVHFSMAKADFGSK